MPKCKVCGYRLFEGVTKCPMCGATAGSTVAGEISPELDLPKYFCPSCNSQILGEHRYCPSCGIDLKEAAKKAENLKTQKQEFVEEKKCVNCGAVLTPNAKFCPECGAKQEVIPVEQASKEPAISKKLKTESKKNQKQSPLTTNGGLVNGQPETPMEAFEFEIEDGKYVLTKLKKGYRNLTEIKVPKIFSVIGNHKVLNEDYDPTEDDEEDKFIVEGAFEGCKKVKNIILPDSISEIRGRAFAKCKKIVSVNLPDNIEIIKDYAFFGCNNLVSIHLPDSLLEISDNTFQNCYKLTDVIIPQSVKRIGWCAFDNCRQLSKIIIPDSVTEIDALAFYNCFCLNLVSFPDSIERIGDCAFAINSDINISELNVCLRILNLFPASIREYGSAIFSWRTELNIIDADFLEIDNINVLELPNTIKSIGKAAFAKVTPNELYKSDSLHRTPFCNIQTLIIPETVTEIAQWALGGLYIKKLIIKSGNFNKSEVYDFLGGYLPKELVINGKNIEYSLSEKLFKRM